MYVLLSMCVFLCILHLGVAVSCVSQCLNVRKRQSNITHSFHAFCLFFFFF